MWGVSRGMCFRSKRRCEMEFDDRLSAALRQIGLREGMHLCLHVSMRGIRSALPGFRVEHLAASLMEIVGRDGSLIVPTFTYNWKRIGSPSPVFDPHTTPSAVGVFSEAFRSLPGVIRTSAPTHSFALWGIAAEAIGTANAPSSPLGAGSPLDWLVRHHSGYVLMLGTHFDSLSLVHYAENAVPLSTIDRFPWDDLGIEAVGVSITGERQLVEIPGCSRSFGRLEQTLLEENDIEQFAAGGIAGYVMPAGQLSERLVGLLRREPNVQLCPAGSCFPCDARREGGPN